MKPEVYLARAASMPSPAMPSTQPRGVSNGRPPQPNGSPTLPYASPQQRATPKGSPKAPAQKLPDDVCWDYAKGRCKWGAQCNWRHVIVT